MPHIAHRARPLALLLVLLLALASAPIAHGQTEQGHLSTKYFQIYYPAGEEQSANWYASFADSVDAEVSDLLGSAPVDGIVLRIYATEAEYMQANPMAETHPGILAHAIPEQKEIGVAVERLRQQPSDLARQSFRHEMTHIVAGFLSGQHLTTAFQEGLAQYNELSPTRAEDVVKVLADAESRGIPLLTWQQLNSRRAFSQNLDLAYPESYTVMAFLADRYGMGKFSLFLQATRDGKRYPDALAEAYGKPMDTLQSEWSAFLPGFYKDGYKQNVLMSYDLAPAINLYNTGHFSEAVDSLLRSQQLYADLGKPDLAAKAAVELEKARKAQTARKTADRAGEYIQVQDYETAGRYALDAMHTFTDLGLRDQQLYAFGILDMSMRGIAASDSLQRLKSGVHIIDYSQAQQEVRQASETLSTLGDGEGVNEANSVLQQMWLTQRLMGAAVLAFGAFIISIGVMLSVFRRSRRPVPAALIPEENTSWL